MTKGRQPILTISPVRVCVSSRSRRRPEKSYPLSASSKNSVSSADAFGKLPILANFSEIALFY